LSSRILGYRILDVPYLQNIVFTSDGFLQNIAFYKNIAYLYAEKKTRL